MSLESWSYVAAIASAAIAFVGFPLLGWQLVVARWQRQDAIKLSTSQVLLAADAVLATENNADVSEKLRPSGEWGLNGKVHPTNAEFGVVDPYLGVFERIFIAYQAGQVNAQTLEELYGYRLSNIWSNERIVEVKLQGSLKTYWRRLIALTCVLEVHNKRRCRLHNDSYFPTELFDRRSGKKVYGDWKRLPPPASSATVR
jgi:hypothetical protein